MKKLNSVIIVAGLLLSFLILTRMATGFPTSEYISGFARVKGVPNTGGKPYMAAASEAIRRCKENPFCVGVSNQRLFLTTKQLNKGDTVYTEKGQPGESHAYVKDAYPTIFL